MRNIKLMADYECHPLWEDDPGVFGDISPDALPISDSLRDDLHSWARIFDATLDGDDPRNSGFESQDAADKFISTGCSLLLRLRRELGSQFRVSAYLKAAPRKGAAK